MFDHVMLVDLSQRLCVGVGAGCLFVSCISILPIYLIIKLDLSIQLVLSDLSERRNISYKIERTSVLHGVWLAGACQNLLPPALFLLA